MSTNLKVNLISYTPEPEKLVASAAKLCYSAVSAEEIMDNLNEEKVNSFIDRLMALGHESPLEHVSFTFAAEGISRTLSHQLVRHRIASYSQQSQRYVRLKQFEYVLPPSIEAIPEAKKLFIEQMESDQRAYDKLSEVLKQQHTKRLMQEGLDEKKASRAAEKMAIEDARYVFPNACETKIVFTMNARSLLNFFNHRCCSRAQWEIRQMADDMLKQVVKVAPSLFRYAGPSCVHSSCSEGNMTCGKMIEIREKYKKILQGAE